MKTTLSIIILSYNTKDLLENCLNSVQKHKGNIELQTIVVDNNSTDGSQKLIKAKFKWVKLIENKKNLGFAKGNNIAQKAVKGKFVLFLNSDTQIKKNTLDLTLKFLKSHKKVGVVTCKQLLASGKLDKDSRRSFPTPWIAFTHFSSLDILFPKSSTFAKYWYGYLDQDITHEIDVSQGAFLMIRKNALDEAGWFDEDYFLNGEDIDLSWKIKSNGYKIYYYPKAEILHLKKASKRINNLESVLSGINAMEIFYKKRMLSKYSMFTNMLVLASIKALKFIRILKYNLAK